jgi:DNA (cytosine-5)-methyltransferase 1
VKALDLCCCQGGATKGLQMAGYHVTGVDIEPQPRYCGDRFFCDDAMAWLRGEREPLDSFDLIWASPPCQGYSKTQQLRGNNHPKLIEDMRVLLRTSGVPYIIENVPGAPLIDPVVLVGSMFGLRTMRPRLFECSFDVPFALAPTPDARTAKMGRQPRPGEYMHVVGHFANVEYARAAMGIDWMTRDGLREAIPPAYAKFLVEQIQAVSL